LKTIAGIAIGLSLAFGIVSASTLVNVIIWPWPDGVDAGARDLAARSTIAEHINTLPLLSKLMTSASYGIAAFFAGFIAAWMAESLWIPGAIIATILTTLAVLTAIPLPAIFWLNVGIFIPASMIGAYFGVRMVQ